jgi:diguanylate cyclase (GGDEF)-like protein/PAS domain S-box-containing protein
MPGAGRKKSGGPRKAKSPRKAGVRKRPAPARARRTASPPRDDFGARYRDLVEHLPVGVYRTTLDGAMLEANQVLADMLGYRDPAGMRRVNVRSLYVHESDRREHLATLERERFQPAEFQLTRRDGTTIWVRDYCRAVLDAAGVVRFYDGIIVDITERRSLEQAIRDMAFHDPLTGLPNRKLLSDRLDLALAQARRNKRTMAVLFLDLDGFKAVNDGWGHAQGDVLLRDVAGRLAGALRTADTVARIGGDEFTVLIPELPQEEGAVEVSRKILRELERAFRVGDTECAVTASIGIALYPRDGETADALLRSADAAMYQAKAQGGNRFAWHGRP